MLNKHTFFSYFLSIIINLFFLVLFFSSLNFNYRLKKNFKIRVRLVTRSSSASIKEFRKKTKVVYNAHYKPKLVQKRSINQKKSIKLAKTKVVKKVVKKVLPKKHVFKKELKSKKKTHKIELSKKELNILKKKLLALEKMERILEKAKISNYNNTQNNNTKRGMSLKRKKSMIKKHMVQSPGSSGRLSQDYLILVKAKLQNNFEVPIYLKGKEDLYAIVKIDVSAKGRILHYTFLKSSSVPEFNQAVERCLKASSPLPVNKKAQIVIEFRSEGIGKME